MNNRAVIGSYYPGDSLLHRCDPRLKLILSLVFLIVLFMVSSFYSYCILTVIVVVGVLCSGVPFLKIIRGLKGMLFLLAFTAILNLFMTEGTPILTLNLKLFTLTITSEGAIKTVLVITRLVYILISTSILTLTTTPLALTQSIEYILYPLRLFRIPTQDIAMMMSIALRFIPTLYNETEKIMKAQAARGADFSNGNIFQRAKAFVPLLIPLFVSAFRRADDLANAMEVRCYGYATERTHLHVLKYSHLDAYITVVFATLTICAFLINYR